MGGKVVGGFEVIEKIGSGVMGDVYKAKQLSMDRVVALKVLSPRFSKDASYVERFIAEARTVGAIGHPNLVQVYDAGEQDGNYFFAMEFIDGPTVQELIEKNGKVTPKEAATYTRDVGKALVAAEKVGIVHRDIKPANIMVTSHDIAKLCDLGLAKKATAAPGTANASVVGTPYYMPPEQGRGEEVDARSDIYALGATLYHMLTGKTPFTAPTPTGVIMAHATDVLVPPHKVDITIPRGLSAIVMKMMMKNPTDRYQSAVELVDDLETYLAGRRPKAEKDMPLTTGKKKGVTTGHREPVPAAPKTLKEKLKPLIIAASVVVVLAIAAIIVLTRPDEYSVTAQQRLQEAEKAVGRDKELALQSLVTDVKRTPDSTPFIEKGEKMLTEIRSAMLGTDTAAAIGKAQDAGTVDQIMEARRELKKFQEERVAAKYVTQDAAVDASDKIEAALKSLDDRESELVTAERTKAEGAMLKAEMESVKQVVANLKEQAKKGQYGDAISFLKLARSRFKTQAALAELDKAEKDLTGTLESQGRDLQGKAQAALAGGDFDKAEAAYNELAKLNVEPYPTAAKKGLADVAAARQKQKEETEARIKQQLAETMNKIQAAVAGLAFSNALAEVNAAKKTLPAEAVAVLTSYGNVLTRAKAAMETLVKAVNEAQPKISASRLTPGVRGVFDTADEKTYYIKSSGLAVKYEWKGMERKDLFKLADMVFPRSAQDRMNLASLAAILGEKAQALAAIEVAGKYDEATTKAMMPDLEKVLPELAPKAVEKEPVTAPTADQPVKETAAATAPGGAPQDTAFWVGFEPDEKAKIEKFFNFTANPVTNGFPGIAQGPSVSNPGNFRVGFRLVGDIKTGGKDAALCQMNKDSVVVFAARAQKPVKIWVDLIGGDPYFEDKWLPSQGMTTEWQWYAFRVGDAKYKVTPDQGGYLSFLDIRSEEGPFEVDSVAVFNSGPPEDRLAEVKTWAQGVTTAGTTGGTDTTTAALSPAAQRDLNQLRKLIDQGRLDEALKLATAIQKKYAGTPDEQAISTFLQSQTPGAAEPVKPVVDAELAAYLDKFGFVVDSGTWKMEKKGTKNIVTGTGAIVSKEDVGDFALQLVARVKSGIWFTVRWRWQGDLDAWSTYTRRGGGWTSRTSSGRGKGMYLRFQQGKVELATYDDNWIWSSLHRDDLGGNVIQEKKPFQNTMPFVIMVKMAGSRIEGKVGGLDLSPYTPDSVSPSGKVVIDTPPDTEIEFSDLILQR
jgi:serine/threonine-protein kinase